MPNINVRNLNEHRNKDSKLYETFQDIIAAINTLSAQTVTNPQGLVSAPPQISSLNSTAADGVFDVAIADNNPVYRGINYFVEYSTSSQFTQPVVIDLGASRNWRGYLGNLTLYFRAYSAYPTSPASAAVVYGNPTAVVGGGSAGPTVQASKGSGTAPDDGTDGNAGFGKDPSRGDPRIA